MGDLIDPKTIMKVARRYTSHARWTHGDLIELLEEHPSVIFGLKQQYLSKRRGNKL